jgi:hypothetical protein
MIDEPIRRGDARGEAGEKGKSFTPPLGNARIHVLLTS